MKTRHVQMFSKIQRSERGASLPEYVLMAALITLVSLSALRSTGRESSNALNRVSFNTQSATSGGGRTLGGGRFNSHGYQIAGNSANLDR